MVSHPANSLVREIRTLCLYLTNGYAGAIALFAGARIETGGESEKMRATG